MRYVLGAIDQARDGYVAIVRRLVRVAIIGVVIVLGVLAAIGVPLQQDTAELPARGGSGRLFRRHAPARRRLDQPHRSRGRAGREHHQADPGRRRRALGRRAQLHRRSRRSNQAFFVIRLKPYEQRTDPSQSAAAHHPQTPSATGRDPAGHRLSLQPAADPRARQHRRVPICAGGPAGPAAGRYRRDDARPSRRRRTSSPSSPAFSAPLPPIRRRSISTSIATRPRCSASRSPTSSMRCNRPWAATTSTTSTFSAAPGRSTSRPRPRFAKSIDDISTSTCATRAAPWCRCARSPSRARAGTAAARAL